MAGMPSELAVQTAGFSPVKGTRHLAHSAVHLDARGPAGDRAFALVDPRAARVIRTVQHPSLMAVVARLEGDGLSLTLPAGRSVVAPATPSGESLTCDYWGRSVELALLDGPHASLLSEHLGHDVRLAAAPRGGVVFGEPVTLVGTASLADLADRTGRASLVDEAARFRATLVVETDEPYVEDAWLGATVRVGDATLRIGGPIPRCAVIDHHPDTGHRDVRLLKALVEHRPTNRAGEPMFGVYATCVEGGEVRAT
jgi:uncharacterized protein YcbX